MGGLGQDKGGRQFQFSKPPEVESREGRGHEIIGRKHEGGKARGHAELSGPAGWEQLVLWNLKGDEVAVLGQSRRE